MTEEDFRAFAAARADLESATDFLTSSIVRAEEAVAALHLGVAASVPFPLDGDDAGLDRRLRFGKVGDRWRFSVETRHGSNPLVNASRMVRGAATRYVDAILEALLKEARKEVGDVAERCSAVEDFVRRISR